MDIRVNKRYVRFDVGGCLHMTHIDTLNKFPDSFLAKCVAPEHDKRKDSSEFILIDRDGKHFGAILNYMRNESLELNRWHPIDIVELEKEADFYGLTELVELCKSFTSPPISESGQEYSIPNYIKLHALDELDNINKPKLVFGMGCLRLYNIAVSTWQSKILPYCDANKYDIYLSKYKPTDCVIVDLYSCKGFNVLQSLNGKCERQDFDHNVESYKSRLLEFLVMIDLELSRVTNVKLDEMNIGWTRSLNS